jgi:hypothetical protein
MKVRPSPTSFVLPTTVMSQPDTDGVGVGEGLTAIAW